ncbi:uncharacterized protein PFL1_06260 [Pseudozyma flocculosa PF-1]|uniref:Yeast cell wall synthesis Kre9/Knh1-like N-terminal domain-containing protein n=2 Tax=Pseudozyma flocculosa TaxID=84751 RepID=A0A5C3F739_9BASI|nr:uncharacterized protein PFL1_06260 [Pseudozyma flocculosa PF-1]EPQ26051.1 hypothetical protein PFL1_06260 [Pseudozyma flocculosa PF-1]SPO40293.1 uncharacterized protein PSFLO_05775 [Pseudozyma flocculosa]
MIAAKVSALVSLLAIAAGPAMATIIVTQPVASTTGHGDKHLQVEWHDDGAAPKFADWGKVNVYLATGSHDVQWRLQTLAEDVDAKDTSDKYKIDPTVGPNGGYYFLRFEGSTPAAGSTSPPMAFSARFTLDKMTGTFNSTIKAELEGAGGTASAGGGASATPTGGLATSVRAMATSSSSTSTSPASAAAKTNSPVSANSSSQPSSASKISLAGSAALLTGLAAAGLALF